MQLAAQTTRIRPSRNPIPTTFSTPTAANITAGVIGHSYTHHHLRVSSVRTIIGF